MSLIDIQRNRPGALLTVNEAAQELRIGRSMAYELARRYEITDGREGLPVIRLGISCLRVPRWALQELMRSGRVVHLGEEPDAVSATPTEHVRP